MNHVVAFEQSFLDRPRLPRGEDEARSTLVQGAGDMATLLTSASPSRAKGFAVAMHERVCEGGDQDQVDFWGLVVELLQPALQACDAPVAAVA